MSVPITEANFTLLAIKAYDNQRCEGIDDIMSDIDRFKYLNKLFLKYKNDGDLNYRIILNHLVILFNVFGNETVRFLFYKIKPDYYKALMPFLAYLSRLDSYVEVKNKMVLVSKIGYDEFVANKLTEI
jgi:hypothetical protein